MNATPPKDATDEELERFYEGLPDEERRRHKAATERAESRASERREAAKLQEKARKAIFYVAVFKAAIQEIKALDMDILGEALSSVPQQAYPREKSIGNKYELSETEIHNLKEKGRKAVQI